MEGENHLIMDSINDEMQNFNLQNGVTLDTMPVEILQLIFQYLRPSYLQSTIRFVCKTFAIILTDEIFWKKLYRRYFGFYENTNWQYPLLPYFGLYEGQEKETYWKTGADIHWSDITYRMDKRLLLWGKESDFFQKGMLHRAESTPHSAIVDTLKIVAGGKLCATGGRDKLLAMWNVDSGLELAREQAHDGWVWALAAHKDQLFSCGWDGTIKGWTMELLSFKCFHPRAPALCIDFIPGVLVAGLSSKNVVLYDPRVAVTDRTHSYIAHNDTITDVKIWNDQILSISVDKTLAVYDMRKQKLLIKQKLQLFDNLSYPRKISLHRGLIYTGDSKGWLAVYDPQNKYQLVLSGKVGHHRPVNAILPSLEGVIVGTTDAGVKFVFPSKPLRVINELEVKGEVTALDFYKNNLALSTTNVSCSVQFYIHALT